MVPAEKDFDAQFQSALNAQRAGDLAEAIRRYEMALAIDPGHVGVRVNLAAALRRANRLVEALAVLEPALAVADVPAALYFNHGNLLQGLGRSQEADQAYLRAFERDSEVIPANARLLSRLGDVQLASGKTPAAEELYRRAIEANAGHLEAHNGLGIALASCGELEGSLAAFERALAIDPDYADALANLATLQTRRNRLDLAIPTYRRALALDPDMEEALTGLVKSLARGGACGEAVAEAEAAVTRRPDTAECYQALGYALTLQGRIDEALQQFAMARALDPEHVLAHLNAAFTSLYSDALSAAEVTEMHRDLAGAVERRRPVSARPHLHDPDPGRRLRVGYLGPDFRAHPVGHFLESALDHHDSAAVDVICYADVASADEVTARQRTLGHTWRDVYGWSEDRLVERIRADGVDILVELAGHTAGHAALLLPHRSAPIQALYLGYPCTSGLSCVDYVISDAIVSPPESAGLYTEAIMALDTCFLCFRPYPDAPQVAPLPATANGFVTFGSFNNLPKVSPSAIAQWSRVLAAVPRSRMLLKAPGLADPPTRELVYGRFAACGIPRDRVDLAGITTPLSAFLGEYGRVDIALDSLPYVGGTTTCEALWMGVPVVTLAGEHFYERMGASILHHAGLPELVATTADDYVRTAVDLASDSSRLAALRAGMRAELAASPVCDGPRYARALEAAYRAMWRTTIQSR